MKTLYHGSSVAVPAPLTGVGRRVCVIRATDTPLLSIYGFDESLLPPDVRRLRLEHYDQQWLDFIVDRCLRFVGTEPVAQKGGQG